MGGKLSRPNQEPRPYTVAVLGAGNVGSALLRELPKLGIRTLSWTRAQGPIPVFYDADLILLAVSDPAVPELAKRVKAKRNQLVAHLAGALPLDVLASKRRGSLHPLKAITAGDDFAGAAAAIAGSDPKARKELKHLAQALGMRPIEVPDRSRALYHASAVLGAGAQVALFSEAVRAFREATNATEPQARAALLPLALGALLKLSELTPAEALTGPAARKDIATIRKHQQALPKDLRKLYDELTRVALKLKDARPNRRLHRPE